MLGRKVARFARSKLAQSMEASEQESQSHDDDGIEPTSDDEADLQVHTPNRRHRRLLGDITPGGLSAIAMELCGG